MALMILLDRNQRIQIQKCRAKAMAFAYFILTNADGETPLKRSNENWEQCMYRWECTLRHHLDSIAYEFRKTHQRLNEVCGAYMIGGLDSLRVSVDRWKQEDAG